jgi:hypothetical protein
VIITFQGLASSAGGYFLIFTLPIGDFSDVDQICFSISAVHDPGFLCPIKEPLLSHGLKLLLSLLSH